ncbi:MAG: DUF3093 domain-containing protein [Actinomycetes bacterium]
MTVIFRERVWAPWWLWLSVLLWTAMLGVAYAAATSAVVGLVVAVATGGLCGVALWRYTLTLVVDETGWTVGRVHLEARFLGLAQPLERAQSRRLRGVDADPRAFATLRGWVPSSVRVEVDDDRDPTPYWLVSTRRPVELAHALQRCRDSTRARG